MRPSTAAPARTTPPRSTTTTAGSTWVRCASAVPRAWSCGSRSTRSSSTSSPRPPWSASPPCSCRPSPRPAPAASGPTSAPRSARPSRRQGGTADLEHGPLGTELRTRMPSAGPDGRTVFAPARFLGVDGPRWFLRGVISGRGAIDDAAAAPLLEVFRETVVVRGSDPMAPRELLPAAPAAGGGRRPMPEAPGSGRRSDARPTTSTPSNAGQRSPRCGDGPQGAPARPRPDRDPARGRRDPSSARWPIPSAAVACAGELVERAAATVAGCVRCVTMPPRRACRSSWPSSSTASARSTSCGWAVAGSPASSPGVFLTAEGRIAKVKGQPTIFNPTYQIVPTK